MDDIIYENTKKAFLQLKEQVNMLKKENKMLRDILNNKEEKPKVISSEIKTLEEYNALDFCKEFQKLYRQHYNMGLHINNYGSTTISMKKIIEAFYREKETNKDILEFIKWAVSRKTHTGHHMNIGYLATLIQTYRIERLEKQTPVSVEIPDVDEEKLKQIILKRSK